MKRFKIERLEDRIAPCKLYCVSGSKKNKSKCGGSSKHGKSKHGKSKCGGSSKHGKSKWGKSAKC